MIDTHCHLLPGLDDGARNAGETIELAAELAKAGVTAIVCTPHFTRRYPTDHDAALAALDDVRSLLAENEIAVELELAAEVGPSAALDAPDAELERRAIARRFLLVELEPDTPGQFLAAAVERLADVQLTPVFAHPERCRAVQRNTQTLVAARERGALAQVVATSLAGAWGPTVEHAAWMLVASGRADLVASDAHRPDRPREGLAPVLGALREKLGTDETTRLVEDAPGQLWRGVHPRAGHE